MLLIGKFFNVLFFGLSDCSVFVRKFYVIVIGYLVKVYLDKFLIFFIIF